LSLQLLTVESREGRAQSGSFGTLPTRLRFPRHKPHQSPAFLPERCSPNERGKTLALPGYRQSRNYSCGFASTLMVARYFAPRVSAAELYEQLGTSRDGTRQTSIVRALRVLGVSAHTRYDVDYVRIRREIDRGKPVIGYLFDDEHWLVLYGYARNPDRVFVADPRPGHPSVQVWEGYGRRLGKFGIVCSPQGRRRGRESAAPPPIVAPERLLGASPGEMHSSQLDFDFEIRRKDEG